MKQTKRHKLCFGTDKGKTFQNRINTDKNSGDSKTVTLVQQKRRYPLSGYLRFLFVKLRGDSNTSTEGAGESSPSAPGGR